MSTSIPIAAGTLATLVFAASTFPMLGKALRTKDLSSYSRSNLVLANVGNLFYSVYVFHLPPGPIWLLHSFYVASSALMLAWSVRYRGRQQAAVAVPTMSPDAGPVLASTSSSATPSPSLSRS